VIPREIVENNLFSAPPFRRKKKWRLCSKMQSDQFNFSGGHRRTLAILPRRSIALPKEEKSFRLNSNLTLSSGRWEHLGQVQRVSHFDGETIRIEKDRVSLEARAVQSPIGFDLRLLSIIALSVGCRRHYAINTGCIHAHYARRPTSYP